MLPLALGFFLSAVPAPTLSADNGMIRSFCLVVFNAAIERAGKTPPDGMGDFTCNCFMDRLTGGEGIEESRAQCTEEAAQRFPV